MDLFHRDLAVLRPVRLFGLPAGAPYVPAELLSGSVLRQLPEIPSKDLLECQAHRALRADGAGRSEHQRPAVPVRRRCRPVVAGEPPPEGQKTAGLHPPGQAPADLRRGGGGGMGLPDRLHRHRAHAHRRAVRKRSACSNRRDVYLPGAAPVHPVPASAHHAV